MMTYLVGTVLHGRTGNFPTCDDPAIRESMRESLEVPSFIEDKDMCTT